jgi:hypothetical protein
MDENPPLDLIRLLLARLERISADSVWAHRASGVRGALLRMLEKLENGRPVHRSELMRLTGMGFYILEQSAKEKF